MNALCPHCGFDLKRDAPVQLGAFNMAGAGAHLYHAGIIVPLTPQQREICWALMKASPVPVKADVLMLRIGSEAEANLLNAQISKIRSVFHQAGLICPITTMRKSYAWLS